MAIASEEIVRQPASSSSCCVWGLRLPLSLTSGASDASAVSVVRDWLLGALPGNEALDARDRLIVYIRLPRVILGILIGARLPSPAPSCKACSATLGDPG
jgi:ABC-type Fe3+-siderophore transport system permease subunit